MILCTCKTKEYTLSSGNYPSEHGIKHYCEYTSYLSVSSLATDDPVSDDSLDWSVEMIESYVF
jgi:hypothetical protein